MLRILLSQHWASLTFLLFSTVDVYLVMTVNYKECADFNMKPLKFSIFQREQNKILYSFTLSVRTFYLEDGLINRRGKVVQHLFTRLYPKAEWSGERPVSDPCCSWPAVRSWTKFFHILKECPTYQPVRCFVVELLKLFHYIRVIQYS